MSVRLTKIYTRTGDDATTGLVGGSRVRKHDPRVAAYGDVDEANACVGLAIASCDDAAMREMLRSIQQDLFDLGADLATPLKDQESSTSVLRITPEQTRRLESMIDAHNDRLPSLESFVLPGGTELAARLHLARTVVRRAERSISSLIESRSDTVAHEPLVYMNRLSDLLFVLARVANGSGDGDVLWVPGGNRGRS
ncbi:MAG: cob(I)yrinic acid a,c-diamide adenosyltransferase [Phycisphaerales bacterium JB043]